MNTISEHEYTTYPRRFDAYKWYKPLIVGGIYLAVVLISLILVAIITKVVFGTSTNSTGYDDMDFFSAAGAFETAVQADISILGILLGALIVRDRPISSYFSSMGGWRWKVFLKTFAVGLVLVGIPVAISNFLHGVSGTISFTLGGFIIITLLGPLQGFAEELTYRGFLMQTVSSWFKLPVVGLIVQTVIFAAVHQYNIIGVINIVLAALFYALICMYSKGLESGTALHIINNMTSIYLAGVGVGAITAEETIADLLLQSGAKLAFFLFIIFADKKLHWFDEVKYDDVAAFNAKTK